MDVTLRSVACAALMSMCATGTARGEGTAAESGLSDPKVALADARSRLDVAKSEFEGVGSHATTSDLARLRERLRAASGVLVDLAPTLRRGDAELVGRTALALQQVDERARQALQLTTGTPHYSSVGLASNSFGTTLSGRMVGPVGTTPLGYSFGLGTYQNATGYGFLLCSLMVGSDTPNADRGDDRTIRYAAGHNCTGTNQSVAAQANLYDVAFQQRLAAASPYDISDQAVWQSVGYYARPDASSLQTVQGNFLLRLQNNGGDNRWVNVPAEGACSNTYTGPDPKLAGCTVRSGPFAFIPKPLTSCTEGSVCTLAGPMITAVMSQITTSLGLIDAFSTVVTGGRNGHFLGYDEVCNRRVRVYSLSKFRDGVDHAVSTWNAMSQVTVLKVSRNSAVDIFVVDYDNVNDKVGGRYVPNSTRPCSSDGGVQLNAAYLSGGEYHQVRYRRHLVTHEFGHVLGINDHYSDRWKGNIMYKPPPADFPVDPQGHDKRDYRELWGTNTGTCNAVLNAGACTSGTSPLGDLEPAVPLGELPDREPAINACREMIAPFGINGMTCEGATP